MHTTLNDIHAADLCEDSLNELLWYLRKTAPDDEPLPVSTLLISNGLTYTRWVLDEVCGNKGREVCVTFAADCADRVMHIYEEVYPDASQLREVICAARSGKISSTHVNIAAGVVNVARVMTYASGIYAARPAAAFYVANAVYYAAYVAWGAEATFYVDDVVSNAARATYTARFAATRSSFAARVAETAERKWQIDRLRELIEAQ